METTSKTCPVCKKEYTPVLGSRKRPDLLIQQEFPNAAAWEREQLITGICSDACWETLVLAADEEAANDP